MIKITQHVTITVSARCDYCDQSYEIEHKLPALLKLYEETKLEATFITYPIKDNIFGNSHYMLIFCGAGCRTSWEAEHDSPEQIVFTHPVSSTS